MQRSTNEYLDYEGIFEGTLEECLDYGVIDVDGWDVIIAINTETIYQFAEGTWEKV